MKNIEEPPKILYAVTSAMSARSFLKGQLRHLSRSGYSIYVACTDDGNMKPWCCRQEAAFVDIPFSREPSTLKDLHALAACFKAVSTIRPQYVFYGTPKAALLFSLASFFSRLKHRTLIVHGFRFLSLSGLKRRLVRFFELLPIKLSTHILCVSPMIKETIHNNVRIRRTTRVEVIHHGSCNGVRISPQAETYRRAVHLESPTLAFVGRVAHDKGIDDLISVFKDRIIRNYPGCRLLLIGDFDPSDPVSDKGQAFICEDERVTLTGWTEDPLSFLGTADVVILPTHRDGFGNACLDAAIARVPMVCSDAAGAIGCLALQRETALIYPAKDRQALGSCIVELLENQRLREKLAFNAYERALAHFNEIDVWNFYKNLLDSQLRQLA